MVLLTGDQMRALRKLSDSGESSLELCAKPDCSDCNNLRSLVQLDYAKTWKDAGATLVRITSSGRDKLNGLEH